MRFFIFVFFVLALTACDLVHDSSEYQPISNTVFEMGDAAPEFEDVEWLDNRITEQPNNNVNKIELEDLEGKVVLLNFWSYDCGFCREVVGWLNELEREYGDQGLEIIGIHTPEFAYEKKQKNVKQWVEKLKIEYLIGLDNDRRTWNAYHNRYRPAVYLIDREGKLQWLRYGTAYQMEMEEKVRSMLEER